MILHAIGIRLTTIASISIILVFIYLRWLAMILEPFYTSGAGVLYEIMTEVCG